MLAFDWIAGSCQVNLLITIQIFQKPVNASPRLKFIRIITFSSIEMFFPALFCVRSPILLKKWFGKVHQLLLSDLINLGNHASFKAGLKQQANKPLSFLSAPIALIILSI